jgi:hypothetical protein
VEHADLRDEMVRRRISGLRRRSCARLAWSLMRPVSRR